MPRSKNSYYYYNPIVVTHPSHHHLPGVEFFGDFYKMIGSTNVVFVDRTHTLRVPVRTCLYSPIPTFRPFAPTYTELCDERARYFLNESDTRELPLSVFWSGGIDSTVVLISLLKNATSRQLKNIRVLLSQDSIDENPNFYRDHLLGKLQMEESISFSYRYNKKSIFIGGEYNDQLFGSDLIEKMIRTNPEGEKTILAPYDRETIYRTFGSGPEVPSPARLNWYIDRFEEIAAKAPFKIETNSEFLWWINFSIKWQSVYFRMLTYAAAPTLRFIDHDFIERYHFHFFGTDDFQLWSLNNRDKKIKDTWNSYKFTAKDLIYDYTKDEDYRKNKLKSGSLYWLILRRPQFNFIDSQMNVRDNVPEEEWYEPENSFIAPPKE